MDYEYNQLKKLFISEIFKFLYLTNINKKSKLTCSSYSLSNYDLYIAKNCLYELNTDLILIKIKFHLNLQIYLYEINNILYTIIYNYITNKVISIHINYFL